MTQVATLPELSAARRQGPTRLFFIGLATFYVLVALIGFGPEYPAFLAGTFPIHPLAHVHGAIMFSWLLLFLVQTILASRGSLRLHRKLGFFGVSLAILMWISMVAASIRQVLAKDGPFFLDIVSLQLVLLVMFTVFFSWAFRARQDPGTHRRAMTFSVVVLLQAATDRILWLPAPHMPDQHWELDLYVYALIVPLFVFDLVSIRRLHPVTLIGTAIVVTGHVVVNLLWGTAAWHRFVEGMKSLA